MISSNVNRETSNALYLLMVCHCFTYFFFAGSSQRSTNSNDVTDLKDSLEFSPLPTSFYECTPSPERLQLDYVDYDSTNVNNINEAPEYAFTVFEYMKARENQFVIKSGYLSSSQTELTPDMRAILVDWMVEVIYFIKMKYFN